MVTAPLRLRLKRKAKREQRRRIWVRDFRACVYCHKPLLLSEMTLDHVMPRSKGGRSTNKNLVSACRTCNEAKADKVPDGFVATGRTPPKPPVVRLTFSGCAPNASPYQRAWHLTVAIGCRDGCEQATCARCIAAVKLIQREIEAAIGGAT